MDAHRQAAGRGRAWAQLLFPPALAAAVFLNTLPGDFVFDDAVLLEKDAELRAFDLRRIFWDNYWGSERHDINYRPLTLLSFALNLRLGGGPAGFHLANVLLNALAALAAYLVLRELLGDGALASLAAALHAVLPIHTEAVANVVGRAEILAALGVLAAWLVQLRNPADRRTGPALLAAAFIFGGLAAKENAATAVLIFPAASLVLRRPLPWKTTALAALAVAAYLALRHGALAADRRAAAESGAVVADLIDNPLGAAYCDPATRAANGVRLLGLYAVKTAAPLRLSADYSYDQIPVLPLSSPRLWLEAAVVAGAIGAGAWLCRRRAPAAALGFVFFPLAFLLTANVIFPIGTMFSERLAYLPSLALPLVLGGLARPLLDRGRSSRRAVCAALGVLIVLYAARSVLRNRDWRDRETLYAATAAASPRSVRAQGLAAEAHLRRAERAASAAEKSAAYRSALAAADRALAIHPGDGFELAGKGEILLRHAQLETALANGAAARDLLAQAEAVFTASLEALQSTNQSLPAVLRLRGEARLQQGRHAAAEEDLRRYVETLARRGAPPDAVGLNFLALAIALGAGGGDGGAGGARAALTRALEVFDRAIALRPDLPEILNNRGTCRERLGDLAGAADDYRRGAEVCLERGLEFRPAGDSAFSFYQKLGRVAAAMGDAAGAKRHAETAQALLKKHSAATSNPALPAGRP